MENILLHTETSFEDFHRFNGTLYLTSNFSGKNKPHLKIEKDNNSNDEFLTLSTNLEAGDVITPYSIKEAKKLISWLEKFIEQDKINQDSWIETNPK